MKKKSLKKQQRKIVPICYRKISHSTSNTSLSQLLSIGSYKKRINELVKNNRSLAVALQDARCETAYQSKVIQNYARDHNKIMFARLKLQGMAKTITQLVTDLHEVVNCLDVNWASEDNLLQKNGLPRDKLKIRAPEVDNIEEESVQSSENEDCVESGFSCSNSASNVVFDTASNVEEVINEIPPSTPENITEVAGDLDLPPILFVEDINDKPGEKLSKERKSSRKSVVNQISLTPELDPDIYIMHKRSSSRKQVIIPSAPSSSRSSRKSGFHRSLPIENTTPKKALESTIQRKLSLVLLNDKESCENTIPDSSFNTEECEEVSTSSDLQFKEFPDCTFVNMKDRGSKNKNSSSPDLQYTTEHTVDVSLSNVLHSEPAVLTASNYLNNNDIECNNTILQSEDMEITEIIRPPIQLSISENSSNTVGYPLSCSDLHLNKPGKKKEINMGVEKIQSKDKLHDVTEQASVLSKDMHMNMEEKSCDAAVNCVKVSNNEETPQDTESFNKKPSESPPRRISRNKKYIYKVFLSSSESESDSTPVKPESNQIKLNKIHRSTVIFKPKPSKRISDKKDEGADKSLTKDLQENKDIKNLLSVYDLDVSNSKKPLKKSKPRSKRKNSSHNKETSKPLSQNCNITKLQGVNYKFTKNENLVNNEQKHQLLQNDSFISETNPAIHTDKIIKRNQSCFAFNSTLSGTVVESEQTSTLSDRKLSSEMTYLKNQELISRTPKSEIRRVSFAPVDLVCNFNKMSVSKTIAGNKKTLCTSKSTVDLEDLKHLPTETKDSALFETNKSSDGTLETSHSPNTSFNFSEETELYSVVLPVTEVDKFSSFETTASLPQIVCDSSSDQNSKSSTKQESSKLSLKRNNYQNKPELVTYDKIDKDALFRIHHSQPSTLSKYKSSHKDISYDNLNKNMEHTNSQTLEFLHEDAQIKTKTSKQMHVTPAEDNMLLPTDGVKPTVKSHKKISSSLKHMSPLSNKNLEHTKSPHKDVQIKTKTSKQLHVTPAEDNMLLPTDDVRPTVKSHKKVSLSLKHMSPLSNKNLEHTNSPHKDVQIKTKTSKQLHVTPAEDNMLLPTDDVRPTVKSHKKVSLSLKHMSPLSNKNLEHTNSPPHKDVQIKTKTSKQLHVTPVEDNMLLPTDDGKPTVKSHKKVSSSLKHKSPLPSPDKTSKKSSICRKHLESPLVLKDVLNLEEPPRESLKRRSKVVNYKEPRLNKKLRRN